MIILYMIKSLFKPHQLFSYRHATRRDCPGQNKCQLHGREFWGLSSHLAIGLLLPVCGGERKETLVAMTRASLGILRGGFGDSESHRKNLPSCRALSEDLAFHTLSSLFLRSLRQILDESPNLRLSLDGDYI